MSLMDLLREHRWESSAALLATLGFAWSFRQLRNQEAKDTSPEPQDRERVLLKSDPKILAANSRFLRYDTAFRTYPSIRTFLIGQHGKSEEGSESPPVLVFIHGLGGSIAQFEPIIRSIGYSATCFGIDFPGCGLSRFAPAAWDAYRQEALTELVRAAFIRNFPSNNREIIIVAHSMGCRVARALAKYSSRSFEDPWGRQWPRVRGIAAICPDDKTFTMTQELVTGALLSIPTPLFEVFRALDRRGGIDSKSVVRFVGKEADRRTRELQLSFNTQSQTPVFRRVAWGIVTSITDGSLDWTTLDSDVHLLLVAGSDDHVVSPSAVKRIETAVKALGRTRHVKAKVLHGSHAVLYDSNGYHGVAALIEDFIGQIDEHLSTSWQLQHENSGGKWDVKNLEKWLSVVPVSAPIGKPKAIFRALKTLRGVDDTHSPEKFAEKWEPYIKAVIDISQDVPVYEPELFKPAAIEYHKFATVSKTPPTDEQIDGFIRLVDNLRTRDVPGWRSDKTSGRDRTIGVHCHYGFNRTGFLICSYLIERCGYSIEAALEEFREAKPPGIKHEHFVDQLFLRYDTERLEDRTVDESFEFQTQVDQTTTGITESFEFTSGECSEETEQREETTYTEESSDMTAGSALFG